MTWWFGNLEQAPSGETWRETGRDSNPGSPLFVYWRCTRCKRRAVTQTESAPSACSCTEKRR